MQDAAQGERSVGVRIVAVGKLLQTTVTFAVGVAALLLVDLVSPETLKRWAAFVEPDKDWLRELVLKLASADEKKLSIVGAIALAYGVVFCVETVGLWRQKTWAEYLTVIVTTSYLPYEIYGLSKEFSVAKLVTIVLNSAVVVYLVVRIVLDRRARRAKHGGMAKHASA